MLDLKKLNDMLESALESETTESLNRWIDEQIAMNVTAIATGGMTTKMTAGTKVPAASTTALPWETKARKKIVPA